MINRRLWLLSGLAALVLVPQSMAVPGQDGEPVKKPASGLVPSVPPSHNPLPNTNFDPLTAEDIISNRLNLAGENNRLRDLKSLFKDKDELRRLTKGLLTEEQLRLLDGNSQKIQQLLGDQRFKELLEDSIAQKKEGKPLTEDQIATLKRLADSNFDPNALDAPTGAAGANRPEGQGRERRGSAQGHSGTRENQQNEGSGGPQERQQSWLERQFSRIRNAIADEMSNPDNAGAFQDAVRSLGGIKEGDDGKEQFDVGGLWKSAAADAATWMASRWDWPGALASAPRDFYRDLQLALPEISGSVTGALARVPADKLGGSGAAGIPVEQIAWVTFAVVTVAIAWLSIGKKVAARIAPRDPTLGPWPVQPNSVASRHDLVLAFEYLALLRLGAAARAANHLAVAARLKAEEVNEERRAAAGTLARLYELARYEPDRAPLGEQQLKAARKNLSMLARAAAA